MSVVEECLVTKESKQRKRAFIHKDWFKWTLKALSIILSINILILMVYWAGGLENILSLLSDIKFSILVAVFVLYSIDWLARGIRWKLVLKNIGIKVPVVSSIGLNFIANSYNLLLPAKLGDAARIVGLKEYNDERVLNSKTVGKNFSSVAADRLLDFSAVIVFIFIILPFLKFTKLPNEIQWLLYFSPALLLILIAGLLLAYHFKAKLPFKNKIPKAIKSFLSESIEGFIKAYTFNKNLFFQILLSLLIWFLESLTAFLFYINIQPEHIDILLFIIFATMIANLTKTLPFTPGGIGTYEAAFSVVLLLKGVPTQVAVSVALIDHLFKNIYTAIFGMTFSLSYGISPKSLSGVARQKRYEA